jgi:hypothetical protein
LARDVAFALTPRRRKEASLVSGPLRHAG